MYTRLCEYCASCGYVVVSVSHPYACKNIQFPDGRMAPYLFPAPFHQQAGRHVFDVEADIWLDDMICALNECVQQNADETSLLYQKIDVSRIGIMGHSLGGSVAINVGRKDDRIKTIINLDGPLFGTHAKIPIEKPLLIIVGSSVVCNPGAVFFGGVPFHKEFVWRYYFNQQWLSSLKIFAATSPQAQIVYIDKIVHGSFSDEALFPDSVIVPFILSGEQAHAVIYAYVSDFFDAYFLHSKTTV